MFGPIRDGEQCEKLRRDLGVYRCRWLRARDVATPPNTKRQDPARYKRAITTMKAQMPHGVRVIAALMERGCRVPPYLRVR